MSVSILRAGGWVCQRGFVPLNIPFTLTQLKTDLVSETFEQCLHEFDGLHCFERPTYTHEKQNFKENVFMASSWGWVMRVLCKISAEAMFKAKLFIPVFRFIIWVLRSWIYATRNSFIPFLVCHTAIISFILHNFPSFPFHTLLWIVDVNG